MTNSILDRLSSPPFAYILTLIYICYVLNHLYNSTINIIPIILTNIYNTDIISILRFKF